MDDSPWWLQTRVSPAQEVQRPRASGLGQSISLHHPVARAVSLNIWREHLGPAAERAHGQTAPPIDAALVPSHWNWLGWSRDGVWHQPTSLPQTIPMRSAEVSRGQERCHHARSSRPWLWRTGECNGMGAGGSANPGALEQAETQGHLNCSRGPAREKVSASPGPLLQVDLTSHSPAAKTVPTACAVPE